VLLIGVPILCALYVVFRLLSWGHPAG